MNFIAKKSNNTLYYLAPPILTSVLSIGIFAYYTRVIPVNDYGALAICTSFSLFINSIANFGLKIVYERNFFEYQGDKKEEARLFYSIMLFVLVTLGAFGLATFFFSKIIAKYLIGNSVYSYLLLFSYITTSITSIKSYFLIYLRNSQDGKSFMWFNIDETIISLLLSLFLVLYLKIGVLGIVLAQIISGLIILLLLVYKFMQQMPMVIDFSVLRKSLRFSLPLTPKIFFGSISSELDKFILGLLNNAQGLGYYNISQRFSNPASVIMGALQNKWNTQIYKYMFEGGENAGAAIGKYLTPFFYTSIAVLMLIVSFSEEFCRILLPPSYNVVPEFIYIFSLINSLLFFQMQPQLVFVKKVFYVSFYLIINIFLSIICTWPLAVYFGAMGAAWGGLLVCLINTIIYLLVCQHYYKIKWEYSKITVIYGIFILSALGSYIMLHFNFQYTFRVLFRFLFLAGFLIYGYRIKFIALSKFKELFSGL